MTDKEWQDYIKQSEEWVKSMTRVPPYDRPLPGDYEFYQVPPKEEEPISPPERFHTKDVEKLLREGEEKIAEMKRDRGWAEYEKRMMELEDSPLGQKLVQINLRLEKMQALLETLLKDRQGEIKIVIEHKMEPFPDQAYRGRDSFVGGNS